MPPVEIQWCDHSSVLLEYLRQLYEEGRFVDVGLECEGRQVKAHKAVISACSPYLEGLLKGNPARSHLIKFNGYSYNSLRAVIDFMYNGKVMVEQEQLAAFLKLGRALQVRGILDIAAQCEEAGLTTAEETKSNAQYSTTVQQPQKLAGQQQQTKPVQQTQQQTLAQNTNSAAGETKKYAFVLDKGPTNVAKKPGGPQFRKVMPNIIDGAGNINKVSNVGGGIQTVQTTQHQTHSATQQQQQTTHQVVQQQQQHQQVVQQHQQVVTTQHQQVVTTQGGGQMVEQLSNDAEAAAAAANQSTLDEIQQALASGQAILQTADNGTDQTLQMVEGQCVVTGSGQTYVVVQEGDNISFVPAEMVQGDLQAAVNGGQVVEGLDPVEQQLAQMEGQVLQENQVHDDGSGEIIQQQQQGDVGSLETMSVVESLVKLGEKQPIDNGDGSQEDVHTEMGASMPSFDADMMEDSHEVGASMPSLDGDTNEEGASALSGDEGESGEGGDDTATTDDGGEGTTEDSAGKRKRQPSQKMLEAMGGGPKRKASEPASPDSQKLRKISDN